MNRISRLAWKKAVIVALVISASLLTVSCSSVQNYIFPSHVEVGTGDRGALLQLQSFSEDFFQEEFVGYHHKGGGVRDIKIMEGEVSSAFGRLFRQKLHEDDIGADIRSDAWDYTVAGLQSVKGNDAVIVGGRITALNIEAKTGITRVETQYTLTIDIECFVGLVGEKKVERRGVHLSQKMLKFSSSKRTMGELLDRLLKDAADQTVLNIQDLIKP